MKKYFLLATTALLLGTSNVMAEQLASRMILNIGGKVRNVAGILSKTDMDWGTFYLNWDSFSGSETKIGSFTEDGFEVLTGSYGFVSYHNGLQQPGEIQSLLTEGAYVTVTGESGDNVSVYEGMEVRNLRYVKTEDILKNDKKTGEKGKIIADLYVTDYPSNAGTTGDISGTIQVSIYYE